MYRILYVDDEPDLLELGRIFLEETKEFTVCTFTSAMEALDFLAREHVDAIVSDYQMPDMDGIQFLVEMRKRFGQIPFILFTGRGREEVVIEAFNAGADFYLQKGGAPTAQFVELAHKIKKAVESRRAADAIARSEEKYRQMVETANEGILRLDDHFRITYTNQRMVEMLGYTPDEMVGKEIGSFMQEHEYADHALRRDRQKRGKSDHFERQFVCKDGAVLWTSVSVTPVIGSDGSFHGSFAMYTDITQRKQAEVQLQESRELLQTVIDNSQYFLYAKDLEGRFIFASQTLADFFGASRDTLLGKTSHDFLPKEIADQHHANDLEVIARNALVQVEEIAEAEDGIHTYLSTKYPLRDANDEVYAVCGASVDITSHIRAEEERRFKNVILTTQQETSPDGILIIDEAGNVLHYNQEFVRIWAIPSDVLKSGSDASLLSSVVRHLADPEAYLSRVRYLYAHKEEKSYEEIQLNDGRVLERFSSPMLGESGRYYGRVWYFRDITERKQNEIAIRESEEKYRLFTEKTNDIIYSIDQSGKLTYLSPQIARYGYTPEAVISGGLSSVILAEDLPQVLEDNELTISTGKPSHTVFRIRDTAGAIHWLEDNGVPLYDSSGAVTAIFGIVRDITERKQAEQALWESEEWHRTTLTTAMDGFWVVDATGRLLQVNEAYCQMSGYSEQELLGMRITDMEAAEAATESELHMQTIMIQGEDRFESQHRRKDGTVFAIEVSVQYRPIDGGRWIAFVRDITARKHAEEALRESEEQYRRLVEHLPERIFLKDVNSVYISSNHNFASDLGIAPEAIAGTDDFTYFPPDIAAKYQKNDQEVMVSGVAKNIEEKYLLAGEERWVHTIKVPYRGKDGSVQGILGIFDDITDRKRAEIQLRERFKELQALYRLGQITDKPGITLDQIYQEVASMLPGTWQYPEVTSSRIAIGERVFCSDPCREPQWTQSAPVIVYGLVVGTIEVGYHEERPRHDEGPFLNEERLLIDAIANRLGHVTERKQLEAKLQESEDWHRTILQTAMDGFWVTDAAGRLLYANAAYCRMSGYSEAELQEMCIGSMEVAETSADTAVHIQKIIAQGNDRFESLHRRKDGSTYPVEISVHYSPLGGGQFYGFIRDITDKIRAEAALRESEEKFRLIAETIDEAFWMADVDIGTIFYISPSFERIWGRSRESLYQHPRSFLDAVHEEDRERVLAELAIEKTGQPFDHEYRIVLPDGSIRHIWDRGFPVRDTFGHVSRYVGVATDITSQKQVEEALRRSEERYRLISESTMDFVFSCIRPPGGTYSIDWMAGAVEGITGYTLDELLAMGCWGCLVLPQDASVFLEHVTDLPAATSSTCSLRIRTKNGEVRWLFVNTTQVPPKDSSSPGYVFGGCRDITERVQAEEALRESEEKYRAIFTSESDAIVLIDKETGTILDCNDAITRIYGYRRTELIGLSYTFLSAEPHVKTAATHEVRKLIPIRHHKKKDGTVFPVEITTYYIHVQGRDGIIAAIRDISERRLAEEAIRQANKKLTLLSSITRHDINNQLTILQGYLTMMGKRQLDHPLNEYFRHVSTAAQQISAMIEFTREYEKIGVASPLWMEVCTLVNAAAQNTPPGVITVRNNIPAGAEVFADPLIVKVFTNLLDNGVRYGATIANITFSHEQAGNAHLIVCEDDGVGIPAEEKEKIFERGFGKNTGLGLFLSREILAITGITIRETGIPGRGARFEMTVPAEGWRQN
jgi:PAS domain S-box-containing protein